MRATVASSTITTRQTLQATRPRGFHRRVPAAARRRERLIVACRRRNFRGASGNQRAPIAQIGRQNFGIPAPAWKHLHHRVSRLHAEKAQRFIRVPVDVPRLVGFRALRIAVEDAWPRLRSEGEPLKSKEIIRSELRRLGADEAA